LEHHDERTSWNVMPSIYMALKAIQLLPNGIGGCVMSTDIIHGQVRPDFVQKMGYPPWFPTVLGLFKLTQAALNWVAGGAYVPYSQFLMAFQLGGASFTHAVIEGKSFLQSQIPGAIFFASTVALQILHGSIKELPLVLGLHGVLASAGFGTGYVIFALGAGKFTKAPLSPVKWRKQRGFS
jgi:hypothetical protein